MGLSVTAYSDLQITQISIEEFEDLDTLDNLVRFYVNEYFPGRNGDINNGIVYSYSDCFNFDCSYSNYNYWRNSLAELAQYPDNYTKMWDSISHLPFYDLIYFSDCKGVIGLASCKKLAKDFAEYQEKAEEYSNTLAAGVSWYFLERYNNFKKAFELASQNGAIKFS